MVGRSPVEIVRLEDFYPTLRLSALAARVCYSDGSLVNGPRAISFVTNLSKLFHYSIFAHSFVYRECLSTKIAEHYASKHFKSVYCPPSVVGFSLRHYVENLPVGTRDLILEEVPPSACAPVSILKRYTDPEQNVLLLHRDFSEDGWMVVGVEGLSRAASHQLVRHTSLNFNMRSQRYSNYSRTGFYRPKLSYLDDRARSAIESAYSQSLASYENLLQMGVKKEDARFVLPEGSKTTLIVSGHGAAWSQFHSMRLKENAQEEIRDFAQKTNEFWKWKSSKA
jgi:thymidylate synthase (FAD)